MFNYKPLALFPSFQPHYDVGILLTIVIPILIIGLIFAFRYKCKSNRTWVSARQTAASSSQPGCSIEAPSYPFVMVHSGLSASADHARHKQTGDENLQLPGLLQLPAPASCMGLSQQLQLQPRLCHLSGGVPGWAGREEIVLITQLSLLICFVSFCPKLYNST